jgi:hypothetical protein
LFSEIVEMLGNSEYQYNRIHRVIKPYVHSNDDLKHSETILY